MWMLPQLCLRIYLGMLQRPLKQYLYCVTLGGRWQLATQVFLRLDEACRQALVELVVRVATTRCFCFTLGLKTKHLTTHLWSLVGS